METEEEVSIDYRLFVAKSGWQWLRERSFLEVIMVVHLAAMCAGLYGVGRIGLHFEDQHTKQVDRISTSFDKALDRMASVRGGKSPDFRLDEAKIAGKNK